MSNQNRVQVAEFHAAFNIQSEGETNKAPTLPPARGEDLRDLKDLAKQLRNTAHHAMLSAATVKTGQDGPDGERRHVAFIRIQLMVEELSEVVEALAIQDLVQVAHEMADLEYVVQGTVLALGMDDTHEACVREIHRANMSKLDDGKPVLSDAGRVVKGPDFRIADCRPIVAP